MLKVLVNTGPERNPASSWLHSVRCIATEDSLILDFKVEARFPEGLALRLLVRLFDRNGNYLTHFVTTEEFTTNADWFKQLERAGRTQFHLLKAEGNRLVYEVNIRDLRDATIVEIGFEVLTLDSRHTATASGVPNDLA